MAVGDDKIADLTVDNYTALKLKHPQIEICSDPDPTDNDCFKPRNFSSTSLSCSSATAIVQGWMAFCPKF